MLILTRKPGETVVVGDDVRITVLAVRGSQIKLGIEAPLEVRVNREEVLERERAALRPGLETARRAPSSVRGGRRRHDERQPAAAPRHGHRQDSRAARHGGRRPTRAVYPRHRVDEPERGSEAA